ncbi:Ppx/GppA phosphatase family protein [Roseibium sp.]|uniref:Ppx/GppA phosphatase family protein n=1 Tax=Roseibium sp. TaxID=1936156 RepID=UPI003262FC69
MTGSFSPARGRLNGTGPIAVVDIGSNSVRLVVYERKARTPTMLFNEKVLAGLGRGIAASGRLSDESIEIALGAVKRFRALSDHIGVQETHVIATAAARDAENGAEFVARVEEVLGEPVRILDGNEEAFYSALGVVAGFWEPRGIVGDMGGGSLELVQLAGNKPGRGTTFPLGGLRIQEEADGKISKAQKIAEECLSEYTWPDMADGERVFYAVGGTWRSLARLHQKQKKYPLHVMHNYEIDGQEAIAFCKSLQKVNLEGVDSAEVVSKQRRALVPFGAVVLEQILRSMRADKVVLSATGVREGLLHEKLPAEIQVQDPVIEAARELSILRARSPEHAEELIAWTDGIFEALEIEETGQERHLRHAACLLSDIGWRAHPDYRGEQSLNIISNAAFVGLDHAARAYLAAAVFYRHQGLNEDGLSPVVRKLSTERLSQRARILGAALRVASLLSASMPGVLPQTSVLADDEMVILRLPANLSTFEGERLRKRLGQFAKLIGSKGMIAVLPA